MGIKQNENTLRVDKTGRVVLFSLVLLFVVGMTYGAISFNFIINGQDGLFNATKSLLDGYINAALSRAPVPWIIYSFSQILPFIIVAYLCGYSAISQPITFILLFVKGLGTGFLMASIYESFYIKGILYCALVLLPCLLISLFCLVLSGREALALSNMIFSGFFSNDKKAVTKSVIKLYNFKFALLLAISLGGAILEFICFLIFGKLLLPTA